MRLKRGSRSGASAPALRVCLILGVALLGFGCGSRVQVEHGADERVVDPYRGVLVAASQVTEAAVRDWREAGNRIVLVVEGASQDLVRAAKVIGAHQEGVEYFVEIGRNPELADAHPEWMASLQGHDEWRRFYPSLEAPGPSQVVKNYPWVTVFYQEAAAAHLDRVTESLSQLPPAKRLWLNDIQGGPSACGCGHPLCRWTADYGPKRTATLLGDDAPAQFVHRLKERLPEGTEIVPILASECEELDKPHLCAGVGCFKGICWKAFSRQLDALAQGSELMGVACFYKAFQRDLPTYGKPGAWTRVAIESFSAMPPRRGGKGVPPQRLIALLQGWDVPPTAVQTQIQAAEDSHAAGVLLALTPIEQSWKPVLYQMNQP